MQNQSAKTYLKTFVASTLMAASLGVFIMTPISKASDHKDGPYVQNTINGLSAGDIAGLYFFNEKDVSGQSADQDRVVLIMTLVNEFSSGIFYQMNVYPETVTNPPDLTQGSTPLRFKFSDKDANGLRNIVLNNQINVGKTGTTNTVTFNGQELRIHAAKFDDPTYFDLGVLDVNFDLNQLPKTQGTDSFQGKDVWAIAVSAPRQLFSADKTILAAWGVTYLPQEPPPDQYPAFPPDFLN